MGPSPRLEALLAVLAPAQVVDTLDQETQGGDRETHGDHHGRDLVLRREQEWGVTVSWGCEESTNLSSAERFVVQCGGEASVEGTRLIDFRWAEGGIEVPENSPCCCPSGECAPWPPG